MHDSSLGTRRTEQGGERWANSTSSRNILRLLHGARNSDNSERDLVAKAKGGSRIAFQQLVERYQAKLFRVAEGIAHNRQDAEDIVQNAFVQAFRNISRFRGDSRFCTWLVRITINESLMRMRQRRWNTTSLDSLDNAEETILPHQLQDGRPNPEERCSWNELNRVLARRIAQLSANSRIIFRLRDIEGFSIRETAEALNVSKSAAKSRSARARRELRQSLKESLKTAPSTKVRIGDSARA